MGSLQDQIDAWLAQMSAKHGPVPPSSQGDTGVIDYEGLRRELAASQGQEAEFVTSNPMPDMPLDERMGMLAQPAMPNSQAPDAPADMDALMRWLASRSGPNQAPGEGPRRRFRAPRRDY